jgi:hypothetical protein
VCSEQCIAIRGSIFACAVMAHCSQRDYVTAFVLEILISEVSVKETITEGSKLHFQNGHIER